MLDVGPAYRRGAFRLQRQAVAPSIVEGVHFLLDDIGVLTGAAAEQAGILEQRRIDALVAVESADIRRFLFYITPVILLFG